MRQTSSGGPARIGSTLRPGVFRWFSAAAFWKHRSHSGRAMADQIGWHKPQCIRSDYV